MKNIFFKLILAAVCVVPFTTGCAFNTLREINDSAYDVSEYQFFDTEDGLFRFGTEPILAFTEGDTNEDYEYSFTTGKKDCLIGIISLSGYHTTAESFGEGMLPDYRNVYENATGAAAEYNGTPAYRITYTESGVRYVSVMLQYGNGDLFVINMTESTDDNEVEKIAENIIATVEYNGERLKTASEEFNCEYFSLTVPPEWYIRNETESGVTLSVNLQQTASEIGVSYTLKAIPDADGPRELANERFGSLSEEYECTTEVTEALGRNAFAVKLSREIMDTETLWCYCYFEIDGICYEQVTSVTADGEEKYRAMTDKISESINFKNLFS